MAGNSGCALLGPTHPPIIDKSASGSHNVIHVELVNDQALSRFTRHHRDAAKWLAAWTQAVRAAQWHSLVDVRALYPAADGVKAKSGLVVTVFNVRGNNYRLLTRIDYAGQRVVVFAVLTHRKYDEEQWKG